MDHWYVISGLDVMADAAAKGLVILGDSITDGRGSPTDGNGRWTDHLARRLQEGAGAGRVGVLNQGLGGNRVLNDGLGPNAVDSHGLHAVTRFCFTFYWGPVLAALIALRLWLRSYA